MGDRGRYRLVRAHAKAYFLIVTRLKGVDLAKT
jgi:hypothetical protein